MRALLTGFILRLDGGENVWVPVQGVVGVVGVLDGAGWVSGCVGVRGDAVMSPCGWGLFNNAQHIVFEGLKVLLWRVCWLRLLASALRFRRRDALLSERRVRFIHSVTLRFPARAAFQWFELDMANGAKARGKKNAKKVPELLVREKKEMFVGKFFPCLVAYVRRRAIKNCVKWPKNIHINVRLNIYVEKNRNGREHVLNGNVGFEKKYSKNIFHTRNGVLTWADAQ